MAFRLAAIYAHPDDDTFGVGGVLALHAAEVEYTLIVATSGEAGQISDPSLASRDDLAAVRQAEEREALKLLGVEAPEVHFLGYPDGALDEVDHAEVEERVAGLLNDARPQVVVTFGPDGVTKHADHIAIGQIATEAFHDARAADESGSFQRLFYNALLESDLRRFWETVRGRGVDIGSPDDPYMPRGVPDHTVTACVDCSSVAKRKLEAIRAHRTQADELAEIPEDLQEEVLSKECFVQAWPPVTDPQGPTLSDLFEGLDP